MYISEWKQEPDYLEAHVALDNGATPFLTLRVCGPNGNGKWVGVIRDTLTKTLIYDSRQNCKASLAKKEVRDFALRFIASKMDKSLTEA